MQKYTRLYDYIHEFQELVYDTYSKHAIAYISTYYNLDTTATIWDDVYIMGGAYETIGDLSGVRWNKFLLLPIFYVEEMVNVPFDGHETGYIKDTQTSVVIPSSYGITPYPSDMIKFEQEFMRSTNDVYPIYEVEGIEKGPNTDKTFWKLNLKVSESKTTTQLDEQVEHNYVFFEYTKKIYSVTHAQTLTRMLSKVSSLKDQIEDYYNKNSGLYYM